MRLAALLSAFLVASCSLLPVPDPGDPPLGYYCEAQPELKRGVVPSADPVADCYVGVLLKPPVRGAGISPADALAFAMPPGAEPLPLINGFVVRDVSKRQARSLAKQVRSATDSRVALFECTKMAAPAPEQIPTQAVWGLDRIDQRELPLNGLYRPLGTGVGARVGINDTGEPLQKAGFANVGPCMSAVGRCSDDHDHGSHVGGTVAHERFGVARDAEIAWCKSLINGSGSSADVVECIQLITDWCGGRGPCIGNMSLGGSADDVIDRAVCASKDAGVLWVVAAGNESTDACKRSPARGDGAITVGATDSGDRLAGFSNQGECVDISAPGVQVTSIDKRGGTLTISGTSMASPHVAGVAAVCAEILDSSEPEALRQCVADLATVGVLKNLKAGTPNSLAFAGQ